MRQSPQQRPGDGTRYTPAVERALSPNLTLRTCDVAIIGAGAAGLATAIFAGRAVPGLRIVTLDGAKKVGAKILVSGGGRCNVTNVAVSESDYWGGNRHLVKRVLAAFSEQNAREFFAEIGVALHEEEDGKLFPDSNSARTVLDALLRECQRLGIEILTEQRVLRVTQASDSTRFLIEASGGSVEAGRVVLATGGLSLPKSGSDGSGYALAEGLGHRLTRRTPALVPLVLDGDFHAGLSGISHPAAITIAAGNEKPVTLTGSLLWTHFGISGPVALDASRHWHAAKLSGQPIHASLSFLSGATGATLEARLIELSSQSPRMGLAKALGGIVPNRIGEAILVRLHLPLDLQLAQLSRAARRALVNKLVNWPLEIRDSRGYSHAEVTAGGIPLGEIDTATMESRVCRGLHLVGEIIDVDGRLGGFNFQWAWATGNIAGGAVARATAPPGANQSSTSRKPS